MRLIGLLIIILYNFTSIRGQELLFQQYTLNEGFVHVGTHLPNTILKDSDGFVWFSSLNGLSRFDGNSFKNYTYAPNQTSGFPNNHLAALGMDEAGQIWLGTAMSGIFILDKSTDWFLKLECDSSEYDYIFDRHIYFIEKDQQGNMWFGGESGVAYWSKEEVKVRGFGHNFNDVHFFYQEQGGTIWLGDQSGLHVKSTQEELFVHIPLPKEIGPATDFLQIDPVTFLVSGLGGHIWAYNKTTGQFTDMQGLLNFQVSGMKLGHDNRIWFWNTNGIMSYNSKTGERYEYRHHPDQPLSLPSSSISDLLIDSIGNLFIMTWHQGIGIALLDSNPFEIIGDYECLEVLPIGSDRLLIRDFKRGGIFYDTKNKKELADKIPVGPGSIFVPSMAIRGDSLLWIWDSGAIHSYHLRTKEKVVWPPPPVNTI